MTSIMHITDRPNLTFKACTHKPTVQEYAVLPTGGTVETQYGTMSFRAGDHLMIGENGALYVISPEQFTECYD